MTGCNVCHTIASNVSYSSRKRVAEERYHPIFESIVVEFEKLSEEQRARLAKEAGELKNSYLWKYIIWSLDTANIKHAEEAGRPDTDLHRTKYIAGVIGANKVFKYMPDGIIQMMTPIEELMRHGSKTTN